MMHLTKFRQPKPSFCGSRQRRFKPADRGLRVTVCKAKDLPSGGPDLIVQPLYTHPASAEVERLQARVAELESMGRAFRACVDLQMVPSWGSPCHDQIHALVGESMEDDQ